MLFLYFRFGKSCRRRDATEVNGILFTPVKAFFPEIMSHSSQRRLWIIKNMVSGKTRCFWFLLMSCFQIVEHNKHNSLSRGEWSGSRTHRWYYISKSGHILTSSGLSGPEEAKYFKQKPCVSNWGHGVWKTWVFIRLRMERTGKPVIWTQDRVVVNPSPSSKWTIYVAWLVVC